MHPTDLDLICDFVNTLLPESGTDLLASSSGLADWLQGRGLVTPDLETGIEDAAVATEFREAIRGLIGTNVGTPISSGALEALGRTARRSPVVVSFAPDGGGILVPFHGDLAGAAARILVIVVEAMAEGSWSRLKLCRNPQCRRAFYDRSKNRAGVWCRAAGCGNRAKVRAHRLRKRLAGSQW